MAHDDGKATGGGAGRSRFATTRWSVVLAAGRSESPDARGALETLCGTYWYPLYAYVRHSGHSAEEAQDLTQAFFAALLEKNYVASADRERGRFRSFLLASLKHFLSKQRDRARAQKRGGPRGPVSLDVAAGESRYALEPSHDLTPEAIFERRWALTVLDRVLAQLERSYADAGKARLFERLKGFLVGGPGDATYAEVGAELGLTEGAVKVAVHRLRRRYRELLKAEIAQTVGDPEAVADELRHLLAAIRGERG